MSDNAFGNRIRNAFDALHKEVPPAFDEIWTGAEAQHRRERRRYATFAAIAAGIAIVVIGLVSSRDVELRDEFLIADSLLNSTQWSAPSDVLLPRHQYDIYREVPFLVEPTNFDEGSLL